MMRPTFLKAFKRGWLLWPARGEKNPAPAIVLSGCQKSGVLSKGLDGVSCDATDWYVGVVTAEVVVVVVVISWFGKM